MDATCAGCGSTFEARSRKAKWCSDRCRKAKPTELTAADEPSDLVDSVRRELKQARAVDTFAGQLALQLAKRLSSRDESGISSLSKELRTVMAAALDGRTPPTAEVEPEDEVDQARRRRDAKARKAAG